MNGGLTSACSRRRRGVHRGLCVELVCAFAAEAHDVRTLDQPQAGMAHPSKDAVEYRELRAFALALAEYVDRRYPLPGGLSLAQGLADGLSGAEKLSSSRQLQSVRMAVADMLEMTRDLSAEGLRDVEAWLAAKRVASLAQTRERIWRRVPKILKRGYIRDDAEYYLLNERLNDVGPTGLNGADREQAGHIVAAYESKRAV
jgi:hypothetical protein